VNIPIRAALFASSWARGLAFLATSVGSFAVVSLSYGGSSDQLPNPPARGGTRATATGVTSQPTYVDGANDQDPVQQSSPYNQQPAHQPRKPEAAKPGYHLKVQPYPYPGTAGAQPKRRPTASDSQPASRPASLRPTNTSYLADEVEKLKANDRRHERRLDALESKITVGSRVHAPSGGRSVTHKVDHGDSLQTIASQYGVSVGEIKTTNHLSSNVLKEGLLLSIPVKIGNKSGGVVAETSVSRTKSSHVVQPGETLSKIARQYSVSRSTLQSSNHIRNPDLLVVGQKLAIPDHPADSSPLKTPASKIATGKVVANKVVAGKSEAGHVASKSDAPKPAPVQAEAPPPVAAGTGTGAIAAPSGSRGVTSYRVEPGDTIEGVARIYGTSAAEIQRKNKLSSPHLPPVGEEIVVPLPGSVSS